MRCDAHPERKAVLNEWEAVFGSPPPAYLSVTLMQRAIAYERQCRVHGGLPAATRRVLRQVAAGKAVGTKTMHRLTPSAHLVREWNGRTYQVRVVEGGFEMDGRCFKSLSAVAKHITGATWSGPRFFGLKQLGSRS